MCNQITHQIFIVLFRWCKCLVVHSFEFAYYDLLGRSKYLPPLHFLKICILKNLASKLYENRRTYFKVMNSQNITSDQREILRFCCVMLLRRRAIPQPSPARFIFLDSGPRSRMGELVL